MNSSAAIIIGIVIFIIAGAAFMFWPQRGPVPGNEGEWVAPGTSNTDTVTVTEPGGNGDATDVQAVQQTYTEALREEGDQDNTKLGKTVVEGEWALQNWVGDMMGGQALLRFSAASGRWTIVSAGGGAWSVEGLVGFGVPENVAISLLADLHQ